jgi:hypothetical protein
MQAHGFLAQAAMLSAATGRSLYGASAPAFSDTRPTYSRDAQDEEATPQCEVSGAIFAGHAKVEVAVILTRAGTTA